MKRSKSIFRILLVAAVAATVPFALPAAEPAKSRDEPAKTPRDALDDQLLDDLSDDLLDPPAKRKAEADAPAKRTTGDATEASALDEELLEDLEQGEDPGADDPAHPLVRIQSRMRDAAKRIGDRRSDAATQSMQQQIVADLESFIRQAEENQSKQKVAASGASQRPSGKSAKVPSGAEGDPGRANDPIRDSDASLRDAKTMQALVDRLNSLIEDRWGHLPQRQRREMQQNPNEKFLPKYSVEIGQYFRRLVEEENESP